MKRFLSTLLILSFVSVSAAPAFADQNITVYKKNNKEVIANNSVISLNWGRDFDINEASEGDKIPFILNETIKDSDNTVLPKGTKFIGVVKNKVDSRWGFRKAKADIIVDHIILPNGTTYAIQSRPEKGELSAPTALNVAKGVTMAAVDGAACIFGAAFIAIECLSIGGLIFAPITGAAMGVALSTTSKGLNYRVKAGTPINFKLDKPLEIDLI